MALTVGREGSHHIILRDLPSGGSTEVGLIVEKDRNGNLRYVRDELTSFAERRSSGPLTYSDIHPGLALTHSQNDWSGGAMQAAYNPAQPNMYAHADGMDMRGANVMALGMKLNTVEVIEPIPNGGAEYNSVAMWTVNGLALTNITTEPNGGSRHYRAVFSSGGADDFYVELPPDGYKGVSVTFTVRAKKIGGSTGVVKVFVEDSAGVTVGSSIVADDYTDYAVTRTIDSAATYVRVGIDDAGANANVEIYVDDITFTESPDATVVGTAILGNATYVAAGGRIALWDNTNSRFDTLYSSRSTITDIVEYDGNIYIARGNGDTAYVYGSVVTWTVNTISSDAKYAHHFKVSRRALWKSRHDAGTGTRHFVNSSTNPINGGSWGTEVSVGSSDRKITALYNLNDTIVVGKEDGLHSYLRVYNDGTAAAVWENITQEFEHLVDSENFERGAEWDAQLYMTAALQSFKRWPGRGANMQDLSSLFDAPRLSDFGGRIRALTPAAARLYMLVDTPTADTGSGKEVWLMSLNEDSDGLHVHTIEKVTIGNINHLMANNSKLWAMGHRVDGSDDEVVAFYWTLPTKSRFPAFDTTPAINTSGIATMPKVDFGLPSEEKAFISIDVYLKDSVLDAEHTLAVKFTLDDGSKITLATLNSSTGENHRTLYFNTISSPQTNAVGNEIQLEFVGASDDTVSVEVYAYEINATYQPIALESIELWVRIGDHLTGPTGGEDIDTKAVKISALETLRDKSWPIEWEQDFDKAKTDGTGEKIRGHIQRGTLRRTPEFETQEGIEVWGFRLIEVKVA